LQEAAEQLERTKADRLALDKYRTEEEIKIKWFEARSNAHIGS